MEKLTARILKGFLSGLGDLRGSKIFGMS